MRIREIELAAAKSASQNAASLRAETPGISDRNSSWCAAASGGSPQFTNAAEDCLFVMLRGIYGQYRAGLITRDQATAEKKKVIGSCQRFEDELTSCREAYGRLQQNIIKAGEYVIAINKSDSESDAGALALAALSLLLNDPTLGRKYRRKFL